MRAELPLRRALLDACLRLDSSGLNQGVSGNASIRARDGMLITPSGMAYSSLTPDDLVFVDAQGQAEADRRPSSEWRFHHDIFRARSDVNVVIHTHSTFATTLACLNRDIPAFHYMVALAGGQDIRCAPYATFGSQALSDHALKALAGRKACLLANHGLIVAERSLERALYLLEEVEKLCEIYWRTLQAGLPTVLSDAEMAVVLEKFQNYGQGA